MSTAKKQNAGTVTVAGHRLSSSAALGYLLWIVALAPDSLMHTVREMNAHRCHCNDRSQVTVPGIVTNQLAKLP